MNKVQIKSFESKLLSIAKEHGRLTGKPIYVEKNDKEELAVYTDFFTFIILKNEDFVDISLSDEKLNEENITKDLIPEISKLVFMAKFKELLVLFKKDDYKEEKINYGSLKSLLKIDNNPDFKDKIIFNDEFCLKKNSFKRALKFLSPKDEDEIYISIIKNENFKAFKVRKNDSFIVSRCYNYYIKEEE